MSDMRPQVRKYANGCFEIFYNGKCYTTDRVGAINHVSQLMAKGVKFIYLYENQQVSPMGYFTTKA